MYMYVNGLCLCLNWCIICNVVCIDVRASHSIPSGSSIENWHSIMRKGLINATGTKLQVSNFLQVTVVSHVLINPRRTCAVRAVCYHILCHYVEQSSPNAIPTASVLHRQDFKNGDSCKGAGFKSYGVKQELKANC